MIGLDRPLRPGWIFETLKLVDVGAKPSNYYDSFESIAKELVGKEGKRKVRTVIFRSFIYSLQESRAQIENNLFLKWIKSKSLNYLKPLFLWKILMDYEIAKFTTQKIALCVDHSGYISTPLLSKKMIQEYGDRDVVKRSLRSFMTTLVHFGYLNQETKNSFTLLPQDAVTVEQIRDFLLLYAKVVLKSEVINIQDIPPELFFFFSDVDFVSVAHEFNGENWEFIRDFERSILILKKWV